MVGLPAELVEALLARCKFRHLADGEYLYKQGDAGEAMYGLLSGRVSLGNSSRSGRELLVMMAEPGDWIGEVSLFDGGPRSHDAVARGASQLLSIAKSDLDELLANYSKDVILLYELTNIPKVAAPKGELQSPDEEKATFSQKYPNFSSNSTRFLGSKVAIFFRGKVRKIFADYEEKSKVRKI